jgi:acylphosphatase
MTMINPDSFQATDENGHNGTVEVTFQGQTRRVKAFKNAFGISAYGALTGRYQSGSKAWPASIHLDERGEYTRFGRDDRASKFKKATLSWAP